MSGKGGGGGSGAAATAAQAPHAAGLSAKMKGVLALVVIAGLVSTWVLMGELIQGLQTNWEKPWFITWCIRGPGYAATLVPYALLRWHRSKSASVAPPEPAPRRGWRCCAWFLPSGKEYGVTLRRLLTVVGTLQVLGALGSMTWYYSLNGTSVAANNAIYMSSSAFVFVLSVLLIGEVFTLRKAFAVAACIAGVIVVSFAPAASGSSGGPVKETVAGYVFVIISTVLYAVYQVLWARWIDKADVSWRKLSPAWLHPLLTRCFEVSSWCRRRLPVRNLRYSARAQEEELAAIRAATPRSPRAAVLTAEQIAGTADDDNARRSDGEAALKLSIVPGAGVAAASTTASNSAASNEQRVQQVSERTEAVQPLLGPASVKARRASPSRLGSNAGAIAAQAATATVADCAVDASEPTAATQEADDEGVPLPTIVQAEMSAFSIGIMGVFVICTLWPVFIILNYSGVEPFVLPTPDKARLLALNMFLDVIYNVLLLFGISVASPLVVSLGTLLVVPGGMLADYLAHGTVLSGQAIGGVFLIVAGFLLLELKVPAVFRGWCSERFAP